MQPWKIAEKNFEAHFEQYGKEAAVFRLTDTATAKATAGRHAFIVAQPSDYMVIVKGDTFFAEVKSTSDDRAFHFGNIQKKQIASSRRIVKAGGSYLFFIKALSLDQWYCVPAQVIHNTIANNTKHLKCAQLEEYKFVL
jgi:penicillin-binding protein-related factor A (putative recombinase)